MASNKTKTPSPPVSPSSLRSPQAVRNYNACLKAGKIGLFSGKKYRDCQEFIVNVSNHKDVVYDMDSNRFVEILNEIFEFGMKDPHKLLEEDEAK